MVIDCNEYSTVEGCKLFLNKKRVVGAFIYLKILFKDMVYEQNTILIGRKKLTKSVTFGERRGRD